MCFFFLFLRCSRLGMEKKLAYCGNQTTLAWMFDKRVIFKNFEILLKMFIFLFGLNMIQFVSKYPFLNEMKLNGNEQYFFHTDLHTIFGTNHSKWVWKYLKNLHWWGFLTNLVALAFYWWFFMCFMVTQILVPKKYFFWKSIFLGNFEKIMFDKKSKVDKTSNRQKVKNVFFSQQIMLK